MIELLIKCYWCLLSFIIGYFFGSIPFGMIIAKFSGIKDIRNIGSKNIGATNVLRNCNKKLALITLLADIIKSIIPILIIINLQNKINFDTFFIYQTGFFVFIGHLFPVWINFKGGKGVATYIGIMLVGDLYSALFFLIIWLIVIYISHYSSLSSLISCLLTTFYLSFINFEWFILSFILTVIIYIKHIENIKRLFIGKENKIKFK